jgi:hypothetical protein
VCNLVELAARGDDKVSALSNLHDKLGAKARRAAGDKPNQLRFGIHCVITSPRGHNAIERSFDESRESHGIEHFNSLMLTTFKHRWTASCQD